MALYRRRIHPSPVSAMQPHDIPYDPVVIYNLKTIRDDLGPDS